MVENPVARSKKLGGLDEVKLRVGELTNYLSSVTRGVNVALRSDVVYHGGGLGSKVQLANGLLRFGFTAARQLWFASKCTPQAPFIFDEMGKRTYAEGEADVEALARALSVRGLGVGSRIGVMARNSRVPVYALATKAHIGAGVYLLNPASSPAQLQKTIEEHELDVIFIDEEYAGHLPADWSTCDVVIGHAEDLNNPQAPNAQWLSFQQLIDSAPSEKEVKLPWRAKRGPIVIMSSGTSGTPKGVQYREPPLPITASSIIERTPWREGLIVQQTASLFHSWGWANINVAMATRCAVVLRRHFDPVEAMSDLETFNVDAIVSSPIFLKEQVKEAKQGEYKHKKMDFVASSGNALYKELVEDLTEVFGPSIQNLYGSTEVSVATVATAEDIAAVPTTAGTPVFGVRLEIQDDDGNVLPPNQPGRIYAFSTTSMRGYTNPRDRADASRGLIAIGDRGYIDENGRLHVLGRADDMIIVGGENVFPLSCEEVLTRMPGVKDLYVRGVDDPDTFQRLAAWVVREDNEAGRALTKESIQDFVREGLAEHSVPREVTFMDELPRNPTGKVMPRMLPMDF